MRFGLLGAGALTFTIVAGCSSAQPAGSSETLGTTVQGIQGGTTDTADTFAVGVCIGGSHGNCQGFCSGALILPNLVVTARHCVSELPSKEVDCSKKPSFIGDYSANALSITTSSNMFQGSTGWHDVKQVIRPSDAHICGNDIALLVLDDQVPSSEAKPITPGVQYSMSDSQYTKRFHAIGYGATDATAQSGYGQRRIRKGIQVLCIPGDPDIDCPAEVGVPANEFVGGDGTCEGDSGSSAFDTGMYAVGKPVSYGVLSRGGQEGNTCVQSVYTRLDAWRDLVVKAADTASGNWALYPKPSPDWTVYVPPPGKDAGTDAPQEPSGSGEIGDPCTTAEECSGGQCVDLGDGSPVCSQSCEDDDGCPDGYACSDSYCVPAPEPDAPKKATTTTTESGCSVARPGHAPEPARGLGWAAAAGVALALAGLRRRRSAGRHMTK